MKYPALLISLILLLCSSANAEVHAVNFSGGAAAVDENGVEVISAGIYDRLHILHNDNGILTGYAAGKHTEYGIMYAVLDPDANPLSEHKYLEVLSAGEGCIVNEGGIYWYLSAAHKYDDISFGTMAYAGDGRILAVSGNTHDDIGDTLSILWSDGISFRTGINTIGDLGIISEGLMPLYDADTNLYGYINNQGAWVIEPAFKYAAPFIDGLAIISDRNGYGIIDPTGRVRLSTGSIYLTRSGDMFASIRSGALRIYDSSLALTAVMPLSGAHVSFTGQYIVVSESSSEAIYDIYGSLLFSLPAGTQVTSSGNSTFIVRSGNWGEKCVQLVWLDGTPLSDLCNSIYSLDNNRLAYAIENSDGALLYGLMAPDGSFITDAQYKSMVRIKDGMYCADTSAGAVILDADGRILNTFISANDPQN